MEAAEGEPVISKTEDPSGAGGPHPNPRNSRCGKDQSQVVLHAKNVLSREEGDATTEDLQTDLYLHGE